MKENQSKGKWGVEGDSQSIFSLQTQKQSKQSGRAGGPGFEVRSRLGRQGGGKDTSPRPWGPLGGISGCRAGPGSCRRAPYCPMAAAGRGSERSGRWAPPLAGSLPGPAGRHVPSRAARRRRQRRRRAGAGRGGPGGPGAGSARQGCVHGVGREPLDRPPHTPFIAWGKSGPYRPSWAKPPPPGIGS